MPRAKPDGAFVTPPEIAAEVGSRPETVIGWIRSGELPAVDFARRGALRPRFRVNRDDLDRFMRRRSVSTAAEPLSRRRPEAGVTQYV